MTDISVQAAESPGETSPAGAHADAGEAIDELRIAAAEVGPPQFGLVTDRSGQVRIAWVNDAALELLRSERDEMLGQPLVPAGTSPTDWSVVAVESLHAAPAWRPATVELPDGSGVAVRVHASRVAQVGWILQLTPMTDAEQAAEQARGESEHRFRALAEHAPVGIVLSEAGVRLGFVNDRFSELAGVDHSRLLGNRWLDIVHPEDLPGLHESLREVLSGKPSERTVRLLSVLDAQRWVQFRLAPVATPRRAAGFIGTVEDITARLAWEAQLAYQASHDPLTGLANRRCLVETLADMLEGRRPEDRRFAILFCDLDGFKEVNDSLGHDAGDRVLIEVGRRLSGTAREHDLVARVAGDEFVIVLAHVRDGSEAEAAAARHLLGLRSPIRVSGREVMVSASIGVALPNPGDTPESLLRTADRGMYQAKAAGAGTYRLIRPRSGEDR